MRWGTDAAAGIPASRHAEGVSGPARGSARSLPADPAATPAATPAGIPYRNLSTDDASRARSSPSIVGQPSPQANTTAEKVAHARPGLGWLADRVVGGMDVAAAVHLRPDMGADLDTRQIGDDRRTALTGSARTNGGEDA